MDGRLRAGLGTRRQAAVGSCLRAGLGTRPAVEDIRLPVAAEGFLQAAAGTNPAEAAGNHLAPAGVDIRLAPAGVDLRPDPVALVVAATAVAQRCSSVLRSCAFPER